jgi:hypothetical protein
MFFTKVSAAGEGRRVGRGACKQCAPKNGVSNQHWNRSCTIARLALSRDRERDVVAKKNEAARRRLTHTIAGIGIIN